MTTATAAQLSEPARKFIECPPDKLLIGEEWVDSASGETFETIDPATGEVICAVAKAGAEDVDRAVKAAQAALEGKWAKLPPAAREALMRKLADLIEENADELAELEALDNGKPVKFAKAVDVASAANHLRYYAGWPTKIEGETIPVSWPNAFVYTLKEPVGVCGQIIPWNFPLLMAAWKIAPALAAGCTVILKPAEQTPLTAIRLGQLVQEAGFPPGVVNVLTGFGDTGAAMVEHPGIAKIAFTGSTAVGREIGAKAGQMLKRVTLELGGKSPNIILPDADLEAAIKGAFMGIYFNTGQACNAGSRLYVHKDQYDEVVSGLAEAAKGARVGPGLDKSTQFGPVVSQEQYERVMSYIEAGREEGAEAVVGGETNGGGAGFFINPTLFTNVTDDMKIAREEIFGPVLVAMPYEDLEEVALRANDTEYGLAAGVWTRDVANAHKMAKLLKAGQVYVNVWAPADPAAPFG
ncbi:MAG TPA: aldehyde dehydrogenase family protein, partial [Thermoleophilaceae bacterium]|nr:aldehyde dehydrogenase family protein [Thermoleophilaceae bacterium]